MWENNTNSMGGKNAKIKINKITQKIILINWMHSYTKELINRTYNQINK